MAEQIATDPAFAEVTKHMQASFSSLMGATAGASGFGVPGGIPGLEPEVIRQMMQGMGIPGAANFDGTPSGPPPNDPSVYMNAMTGLFQNPQFVQMAEKLGKQIIEVCPCVISQHFVLIVDSKVLRKAWKQQQKKAFPQLCRMTLIWSR